LLIGKRSDGAKLVLAVLIEFIQRAGCPDTFALENMRVNHGRFHVAVAEEFLESPDVGSPGEQLSCEGVPEHMGAPVVKIGGHCRLANGPLHDLTTNMVPPTYAASGVERKVFHRPEALPGKHFAGIGVFPLKHAGQRAKCSLSELREQKVLQ
jgi:hypothetical protein